MTIVMISNNKTNTHKDNDHMNNNDSHDSKSSGWTRKTRSAPSNILVMIMILIIIIIIIIIIMFVCIIDNAITMIVNASNNS